MSGVQRLRPEYEKPVLLDLGELASGSGTCVTGTTVTNNKHCSTGNYAGPDPGDSCSMGNGVSKIRCSNGGSPTA